MPHRSPFRYPGGKTWFIPTLRKWLSTLSITPTIFIEPFAGGAIVGLTTAFENLSHKVLLVELDNLVASVWETLIVSEKANWLADQIVSFDFTAENVNQVLETPAKTTEELAFQTIIKNRVNHGGILANGAGKLKLGENNKGLGSRWYPETLQKRIRDIVSVRSRLNFVHGDGISIIQNYVNDPNAAFFIDPPYTIDGKKAGSRLYNHSDIDHEELFRISSSVLGNLLMTYDDTPTIRRLATYYGLEVRSISMKNTHHNYQSELIIGRNLDWLANS
ncbi:MAG: DNA adenine methylase [Anaerolineae bacterium]|nr:DNA adenine methylase [Anaerolineae bacterium]